ncbi:MAG: methylenetetrahydrofolate reductase C-terminal domain-containing protein [Deltaproteobacteria bacterium]|nr:methylenetetrahydrofolate reductase C-terminal domain-containing protein [Deltaproteobacteria bacterium]
MIVAERKPFEEIKTMLKDYKKVLTVGCGTCVAVCLAGGEKEVGILNAELSMARKIDGNPIVLGATTLERQCDMEFLDELENVVDEYDALLSMACGAGIQFLGGICPVTMCAKGLYNGPCGGTDNGKCEIHQDQPCAWFLIHERLAAQGRLDLIMEFQPITAKKEAG